MTGPCWRGQIPGKMRHIVAPPSDVWALVRILVTVPTIRQQQPQHKPNSRCNRYMRSLSTRLLLHPHLVSPMRAFF